MFRRILLLLCVILGLQGVGLGAENASNPTPTELYALNIGKADCIILCHGDSHYLVDTGWETTSDALLDALRALEITHLDGVFITHAHKDHTGGLEALLSSAVTVDAVYTAAYSQDRGAEHAGVVACARHGYPMQYLSAGDRVQGNDPDVYFDVLGPLRLNQDNENNNSLVMAFYTPNGCILLTGDMKSEEEFELCRAGVIPDCDVLKVPFHGDDTACGDALLKACTPRMAVISTSTKEESDTPSREVLRRLAGRGCECYVTQDCADALCITLLDGKPTAQDVTFLVK